MSAGWKAIRWAKTAPPVRRKDGKPDSVAQHVLLVLATFADKDCRARPGLSTLASETYLTDDTVDAALDRLLNAGLISRGGSFNGTTVWTLNVSVGPDGSMGDEFGDRRERARIKRNERQKRWKERRKVTVPDTVTSDGMEERYLTVPKAVTSTEGNGAEGRQVTVPDTVSNGAGHRQVTVPTSSSPQVTPAVTAIELPLNCHRTTVPPSSGRVNGHDQNGAPTFEDFYSTYPRKRGPVDARRAWDKAVAGSRKAPAVDPAIILAGARRFAIERAGKDSGFTPYPASWLNKGMWADEPDKPAAQRETSGYKPWTNPQDQSAYDEELM